MSANQYKKIRKNAKKKIRELLDNSYGVIVRTSSSRIDDSYDHLYRISSTQEALDWLEDKENYSRADCHISYDEFIVGGQYGFETRFIAFYNESEYKRFAEIAKQQSSDEAMPTEPVEPVNYNNVVMVDFKSEKQLIH